MDEAGNTGEDLFKSDQAFFTLGALGVSKSAHGRVTAYIEKLKATERITFELKGKAFLNSKYEPLIKTILENILPMGCIPLFTVLEKRFMIAAKIVENYFDPQYNDKTDDTWTHPGERKIKFANYFYDVLSDATLQKASTAMQKGGVEAVTEVYDLLMVEINDDKTKRLLKGVKPNLESLAAEFSDIRDNNPDGIKGGVINSPNYTLYFDLVNRMVTFLINKNAIGNLIFDSSREYNDAFQKLFLRMRDAKTRARMIVHYRELHFGFDHLKSFELQDSKDNLFLQVTDLLTTSINSFFRKVEANENLWELSKCDEFLIGIIWQSVDLRLGDWVVSNKLKLRLGHLIRQYLNSKN